MFAAPACNPQPVASEAACSIRGVLLTTGRLSHSLPRLRQRLPITVQVLSSAATCHNARGTPWTAGSCQHSRPGQHYSLRGGRQSRHRCVSSATSATPAHPSSAEAGLGVEEAWALLQELTRRDVQGQAQALVGSADKRARLRRAVLVAAAHPYGPANWDPAAQPRQVLLGVLASNARLAVRALRDYCAALNLPFVLPESKVPGGVPLAAIRGVVFVKHNAATGVGYVSSYSGRDRGVLLTLGQTLVGHLPLGLFDEAMASPAPKLGS